MPSLRFVVKALSTEGVAPSEFARTMAPHPLMYQELPHDPEYQLYNDRLTPVRFADVTADEMYWKVRREVVLRHTGEMPIEFVGTDAERLANRVFPRDVCKVRVGRCSYQFACYHDGGMINDGVMLRLADDRFWMAQADGDLYSWYRAHAADLDVEVRDPDVWVSQVQGPHSLEVLAAVVDGDPPDPFRYFDIAEVSIAGQPVTITRSGFTNELGWEFYLGPDIDREAVGDRILEVGRPFGMIITSAQVFRARRIEAGLLNAGSDFDRTVTPFEAGLGGFVEFGKDDFIGKAALERADRACRTWGLRTEGGIAQLGRAISRDDVPIGQLCSTAWSPYLQCGVAIVRMDDPADGPGTQLDVESYDGMMLRGELCTLPMYDPDRLIPRGRLIDIPDRIE
ncbi:aminomethyltransferase family protein [Candidatus Poriferisodalis sp.]|uniref:aminomethyltransferase family protein n=1 Tax=Candidatus Poriferisodalis sp. TaxID=3101277 RepID=UPI003AF70418